MLVTRLIRGSLIASHTRVQGKVRTATVNAYLGREDDIVIAIFGKERAHECKTFYLRDPYLLNVQLSRYRGALYTIGKAEILRESSEYCINVNKNDVRMAGWEKMRRTLETILQNQDVMIKPSR